MAAAAERFADAGYVATTMESVAQAAGVAVQTVYYVFGTKARLLSAVLDARISGDLEPVPLLARGWVEDLASAPDADTAVRELVEHAVTIVARAAPVYEVLRQGAADPEVRELFGETRRRRREDQRRLITVLADAGHLPDDVDAPTVADVFYAVANEEVFHLLVVDCGWSVDRYTTWAHDVLVAETRRGVKPSTAPAGGGSRRSRGSAVRRPARA